MSKQTERDKKLFASTDPKEQQALAKELGVTRTHLMKVAYALGGNFAERSVAEITAYIKGEQAQPQAPSIAADEVDPAPDGEVL